MNKKLLKYFIFVILVYFLICVIFSVYITRKTRDLLEDAYINRGVYRDDLEAVVSQKWYERLAGYGSGLNQECVDETYEWTYDIEYVHTFSFIFFTYTYLGDSCRIYKDYNHYTGYDRAIKIRWGLKDGNLSITQFYEYVQPGFLQILFDKIYHF